MIGLQALAKLAETLSKDANSVRVTFEQGENGNKTYMSINSATFMILQKQIVRTNYCAHYVSHVVAAIK